MKIIKVIDCLNRLPRMRQNLVIFIFALAGIAFASSECQRMLSRSLSTVSAICGSNHSNDSVLFKPKLQLLALKEQQLAKTCRVSGSLSAFGARHLTCLRLMGQMNQNPRLISKKYYSNASFLSNHTKKVICDAYDACMRTISSSGNATVRKNDHQEEVFDDELIAYKLKDKKKPGKGEKHPEVVKKVKALRTRLDIVKSGDITILVAMAKEMADRIAALKREHDLKQILASPNTMLRLKMQLSEIPKLESAIDAFLLSKKDAAEAKKFLNKILEFLKNTDGISESS